MAKAKRKRKSVEEPLKEKRVKVEGTGFTDLLPTRESLLRQLLIAAKSRNFVVVQGCIGSGKTFLCRCVAQELGLPMHSIQITDQMDSKNVFGSYICTEVAGHFDWRESTLCGWLKEDCVIVLEDLHSSTADTLQTLVGMAVSRRIPQGQVKAIIMATHSIDGGSRVPSTLSSIPFVVPIPPLSDGELRRLVASSTASHLSASLCRAFRAIQQLPSTNNSRILSANDYLLAFSRLSYVADLSSPLDVLLELLDVWCSSDLSPDRRDVMSSLVASALSVNDDQLKTIQRTRCPDLVIEEGVVRCGRFELTRGHGLTSTRRNLAYTKDTLQLMERIAGCVCRGEPCLLVGETGVGKTAVVEHLAHLLGRPLRIVNVGPSTDSDQLISGFKPTTYLRVIEPLTARFSELLKMSFDEKKNGKYLEGIQRCLSLGRVEEYLQVVEATCTRVLEKKMDTLWVDVLIRARRVLRGLRKGGIPFCEMRGIVREAAEEGEWLLVDEMNLASAECLDAIMASIRNPHPAFRLFACMNPPTDAGKRRLPLSVRSKMTEFYVAETVEGVQLAKNTILLSYWFSVVSSFLPLMAPHQVQRIIDFYLEARQMFPSKYSLRTLSRALMYTTCRPFESDGRSLYEGISLSFLTALDPQQKITMKKKIMATFPCNKDEKMRCGESDELVGSFAVPRGPNVPFVDPNYVLTPTVSGNLAELSRAVALPLFPVLLEGETSAGKTSLVTYLGRRTGNVVIRINNHEHTDMQEYMGSYVADENGRLVFREGPLVEAVRKGHWVILDELNLAPSDILETLNRLLDDNREIFVAESGEVLSAHPNFRLFATQNPVGTYAGRKRLSRALLSRFVLLNCTHLPMDELSSMIATRCSVSESVASKMVTVLSALRLKRSLSGVFSVDGLVTLRDVFRWATRVSSSDGDWQQALVDHGYFVLASRCRNASDENAVVESLESILKRKVEKDALFQRDSPYFPSHVDTSGVVMTFAMRRLLVLAHQAWLRGEAVLVVGETGEGKTLLAQLLSQHNLLTLNCHERTETADLLGRLRPLGAGFEWNDGIVIRAMTEGKPLLLDEISLAEDSVLERLNSLFEDDRTILLTDAGVEARAVTAASGFQLIATMNPGGDHGKKELSRALRNRFTEIWTSCDFESSELVDIFVSSSGRENHESKEAGRIVVEWIRLFCHKYGHHLKAVPSVRDVVSVCHLWCSLCSSLSSSDALFESISACFLDSLESVFKSREEISAVKEDGIQMLRCLLGDCSSTSSSLSVSVSNGFLRVGALSIPLGPLPSVFPADFSLSIPTCVSNMYRLIRGLHGEKPILLEGSPGCGKSSTVMALASISGNKLTRLNLSDQTDLSDLFGRDVPVVRPEGLSFEWQDGPVLAAIRSGSWLLLDEMNLASQSVLEGLNACFDHRRMIYIAELGKEFIIPEGSNCRFFACQNPSAEGGNRKTLPKSFFNRFTTLYIDDLRREDLVLLVAEVVRGDADPERIVRVNERMVAEQWSGGPFSFNLRDILRWIALFHEMGSLCSSFEVVFVSRLRKEEERVRARCLFEAEMAILCRPAPSFVSLDQHTLSIGPISIPRVSKSVSPSLVFLPSQSSLLLSLACSVHLRSVSLIVGPPNSGRRSSVRSLAALTGRSLHEVALSADTDAQELIGSYEQKIDESELEKTKNEVIELLSPHLSSSILDQFVKTKKSIEMEKLVEIHGKCIPPPILSSVRSLISSIDRREMSFQWVPSVFVQCFTRGEWLLLDNVNTCSAAVLDRLNCCLESSGELLISEGVLTNSKPHPDFRVFLCMDPSEGEISRAMRNRSIEIFIGEQNKWYTRPDDVTAVVEAHAGKTPPTQTVHAMCSWNAAEVLRGSFLLRDMESSEVMRTMGKTFIEDDMQIADLHMKDEYRLPSIDDMKEENCLLKWMATQWEPSPTTRLVLFLASSPSFLSSEIWKNMARDWPIPSSNNDHLPFDARFNGGVRVKENVSEMVVVGVCRWMLECLACLPVDPSSALALQSLSPYKLRSHPLFFDGIEQLAQLEKKCLAKIKKGVEGTEKETFLLCLRVLLFCDAIRCSLSLRSGSTRIRLAWDALSASFPSAWLDLSSLSAWLAIYERRPVDPFSHEEESFRFRDRAVAIKNVPFSPEAVESREEEEASSGGPSSLEDFSRIILRIIHGYVILNGVKCTMDGFGLCDATCSLPWLSSECEIRLRSAGVLSWCTDGQAILRGNPLRHVLRCVWEWLSFDASLSTLRIRDLGVIKQFSWMLSWLAVDAGRIGSSFSAGRCSLGGVSRDLLSSSCSLMESVLPPSDALDPVIVDEERQRMQERTKGILHDIQEHVDIFRRRTSGQTWKIDEASGHPILSTVHQMIREMEDAMETTRTVYRGNAQLFFSLIGRMRQFLDLTRNVLRVLSQEATPSEEQVAKLDSFIAACTVFINEVCVEYCSLLDIVLIFWLAVVCCRLSAWEVREECLCWIRRKDLMTSSNFPPSFQYTMGVDGFLAPSLLSWCVRSGSPMPLHLQVAVVAEEISRRENLLVHVNWIIGHWRTWTDKHIETAKEKEYEYAGKTMEEKEIAEMEAVFGERDHLPEVIRDEWLFSLLEQFVRPSRNPLFPLALMWIERVAVGVGSVPQEWSVAGTEHSLNMFRHLSDDSDTVDVYEESSKKEMGEGASAIRELVPVVDKLRQEWPEMSVLSELADVCGDFLDAPVSHSQQKMLLLLERVLEKADEWESIADRLHSLSDSLSPLRQLLVRWRQMEVRGWPRLLARESRASATRARLVALPLFEAVLSPDTNLETLLAMAIEWISSGCLADYSERLRTVRILGECASAVGRPWQKELHSIATHFEQFFPAIEKKIDSIRTPIEDSIKDFVQMAKYKDLNLLNIKATAHKSHTQLFKMIRKYREAMTENVAELINFASLGEEVTANEENLEVSDTAGRGLEGHAHTAANLSKVAIEHARIICEPSTIDDFTEKVKMAVEEMSQKVSYTGTEEENEKEQGRKRHLREQTTALILGEAKKMGIVQKAKAKTAEITRRGVVHVQHANAKRSASREGMVRRCVVGHNDVARLVLTPNEQMTQSVRKRLSWSTDWCVQWLLDAHSSLCSWESVLDQLSSFVDVLPILTENVQNDWHVCHEETDAMMSSLEASLSTIERVASATRCRLSWAPEGVHPVADCPPALSPFSSLSSTDREPLTTSIENILSTCSVMRNIVKKMRGPTNIVFSGSVVSLGMEHMAVQYEVVEIQLSSLSAWFPEDVDQMKCALSAMRSQRVWAIPRANLPAPATHGLLLLVQHLYKGMEETDVPLLDRLSGMRDTVDGARLGQLSSLLSGWSSSLHRGASFLPTDICTLSSLLPVITHLLSSLIRVFSASVRAVASFVSAWLRFAIRLLSDGFVNPIPKQTREEEGGNATREGGEGGGMGEGKGTTDVTDQMDESGQLDDLKGEHDDLPGETASKENDKPIEMEDDFAEDLQDIDGGKGDEEEEDGKEEEEAPIDDMMGDVDDKEEDELDPGLWEDEQDKEKQLDQQDTGAKKNTNEKVAPDENNRGGEEADEEEEPAEGEDSEEQAEGEDQDEHKENVDERDEDMTGQEKEDDTDDQDTGLDSEEVDREELADEEDNDEGTTDVEEVEETKTEEENGENEETPDTEGHEDESSVQTDQTKVDDEDDATALNQSRGVGGAEKKEEEEEDDGMQSDGDKGQREGEGEDDKENGESAKDNTEEKKSAGEKAEEEKGAGARSMDDQEMEVETEVEEREGQDGESQSLREHSDQGNTQMSAKCSMEEARGSNKEHEPRNSHETAMEEVAEVSVQKEHSSHHSPTLHLGAIDMATLVEEVVKQTARPDEKIESFSPEQAEQMWNDISQSVSLLAAELAENLRLILEPQLANRLQGDYRSGKRLNMRRLIPFVASEYRKDKIWMRRTKKAQRDYQVMVAVDDSMSMRENGIEKATCQGLSIVDAALHRVAAGSVSLVKFGTTVSEIVPFGESISGPSVLSSLSFGQSETDLVSLLRFARRRLSERESPSSEQLLLIISDGRGTLTKGSQEIRSILSEMGEVTVLFVILDCGGSSIFDQLVASFSEGRVSLVPYLAEFPFPLYVVAHSIWQVPSVLAEALRQWMETRQVE